MKTLFTKAALIGSGLAVGIIASVAIAVTVGTVKTWTTGETLTAADLNSTITSLKTALEAIPNWTKSGTNAVYTDGNVGIGTATPIGSLHVAGSTSVYETVENTGTGYSRLWFRRNGSFVGSIGVNNAGVFGLSYDSGSDKATPDISINSTGNVGIGTTTPVGFARSLEVASTVAGSQTAAALTTGDRFFTTVVNNSDVGGPYTGDVLSFFSSSGKYHIGTATNSGATLFSAKLSIDSAGNVGIGTTTPGYPLTMGSGAYVTTGGAWTNASSREYKENLEDLTAEEALAAVMALDPQKFSYKKDKGDCPPSASDHRRGASLDAPSDRADLKIRPYEERAPHSGGGKPLPYGSPSSSCAPEQYVGFIPPPETDHGVAGSSEPASWRAVSGGGIIAEDVPDLVATNDRKGLSSMDLVAVLTKVVQEQQERMDRMQGEIETLKRAAAR